jgi:hypothetical protein
MAGAAARRAVPHSPQNFTVGELDAPHEGHVRASAAPHSPQNFRSDSFPVPQAGHKIVSAMLRTLVRKIQNPLPRILDRAKPLKASASRPHRRFFQQQPGAVRMIENPLA